jgi:hypothetical protein
MQFKFPGITRFVHVKNTSTSGGPNVNFGFTANGVASSNYYSLVPGESIQCELRCTALFINCSSSYSVSVVAGLTGIPAGNFPVLTGSAGFLTAVG